MVRLLGQLVFYTFGAITLAGLFVLFVMPQALGPIDELIGRTVTPHVTFRTMILIGSLLVGLHCMDKAFEGMPRRIVLMLARAVKAIW